MMPFSCPRTCPRFEDRDLCRFTPVLRGLGPTVVTSHTTTVAVEYHDREVLARAAVRLGGHVLGEGAHRLYSSTESGLAIQLPGWRYPIVLRQDGVLAMDHYGGRWGRVEDLTRLEAAYAIEAARQAAEAQGWMVEERGDALVIYHPSGGTLTVTGGTVDAAGFLGCGCHEAAALIEQAIGREAHRALKPEYFAEHAQVRVQEEA